MATSTSPTMAWTTLLGASSQDLTTRFMDRIVDMSEWVWFGKFPRLRGQFTHQQGAYYDDLRERV